jgi:RNA polymerase sigma-70 factor (ECF subfamily)
MCLRVAGSRNAFPAGRKALGQTSAHLIDRARNGDSGAVSELVRRHGNALRRWARGRLPRWARELNDTSDLVQDALLRVVRRLDQFEHRGQGAFTAYLRQAVLNRVRNEMRRVSRRPVHLGDDDVDVTSHAPSPLDAVLTKEQEARYKRALATLSHEDCMLVVGRLECGYNYVQLALVCGRATPDAARVATRRALLKLAKGMTSG